MGLTKVEMASLGLLALIVIAIARFRHDFTLDPFEDAAMLMRYAQHMGDGHGIVWNIGEEPLDGATDFLFMVAVAGLYKLGLSLENSVLVLAFSSHILLVALVYFGTRRMYPGKKGIHWISILLAFWIVIGPGLYYTEFFFGTTVFALFIALSWYLASRMIDGEERWVVVAFAVVGLMTGLIRPEGVLIVGFMFLAVVYKRGIRSSWRIIATFLLIFGVLGAFYFFWRWSYFGHPLPNPFYKKGGGFLYVHSLLGSISNVILFSVPFIPVYILGFFYTRDKRRAIFSLIPIVGSTLMWVLLSDEMNHLGRFQYPILPIILLSFPFFFYELLEGPSFWEMFEEGGMLLKRVPSSVRSALIRFQRDVGNRFDVHILLVLTMVVVMVILPYGVGSGKFFITTHPPDGRYEMAKVLGNYSDEGYTIATTEAGLIPLYSGWRSIDTWGLNDQHIAHTGMISDDYLDEVDPEVIFFHGFFTPAFSPPEWGDWNKMVIVLNDYAISNNYTLAAAYGTSAHDAFYAYVRPDFEHSEVLIQEIREMEFRSPLNGKICFDFREPEG